MKPPTIDMNAINALRSITAGLQNEEKENAYWAYDKRDDVIIRKKDDVRIAQGAWLPSWYTLLIDVRAYFRLVFDVAKSEAQVLCVPKHRADALHEQNIPHLGKTYHIDGDEVQVFVLPQYNTPYNSIISEDIWQSVIVRGDVQPIARIHSHHILDAYQSSTDYASLNSNTLEIVLGRINTDKLEVGYWLDIHNTDTKSNVWVASEQADDNFEIKKIRCGRLALKP